MTERVKLDWMNKKVVKLNQLKISLPRLIRGNKTSVALSEWKYKTISAGLSYLL